MISSGAHSAAFSPRLAEFIEGAGRLRRTAKDSLCSAFKDSFVRGAELHSAQKLRGFGHLAHGDED